MALRLDLAPGDVLRIGTGTVIRVESKSGNRTRVSIESDYRVTRDPARVEPPAASSSRQGGEPAIKRPR